MRSSVYRSAFVSGARSSLAQPGELAMKLIFYLALLVVFEALWSAATAAAGGAIGTYDRVAMVWYIAATQAAVAGIEPRLIETTGDDIGGGTIAVEMLRPVSVVGFRMAHALGAGLVWSGSALVVALIFVGIVVGMPPDPLSALAGIPAVALAVVANLASQHFFAAAAFWVEDAKGAWFLYQKLVFIVGGMLLPLEFFPGALETVAWFTPFMTMAYVPGRLISGHPDVWLLGVQTLWIGVLLVLAAVAFRAGERRLQVVGG